MTEQEITNARRKGYVAAIQWDEETYVPALGWEGHTVREYFTPDNVDQIEDHATYLRNEGVVVRVIHF